MSHAADPHTSAAHGHDHDGQEAGGHEHIDAAEGPDELAPDEPKTPLWLTALGGALFLGLAIAWLGARPSEPTLSELSPAPSASASAAAEVVPPPAPPPQPPPVVPALVPSAAPSAKPGTVPANGNKPRRTPKPQ